MTDFDNPPEHLRDRAVPQQQPKRPKVVRLDSLDSVVLPPVPEQTEVVPHLTALPEVREPENDDAAALLDLTQLGLKKAREILEIKLDPSSDEFTALLRVQTSIVGTVFTAQLRADEGQFRKKSNDNLTRLLNILDQEERAVNARRLN